MAALRLLAISLPCALAEYTHLQFVGFPMQTGYNAFTSDGGLFYQDGSHSGQYAGLADPSTDVTKRIELMSDALRNAAASSAIDNRPTTLKIFAGTEFFFRGAVGAYNMSHPNGRAAVEGLASSLAELIKGDEWSDWLGFFGTTIGFQQSTTSTPYPVDSNGLTRRGLVDTYNFAMIRRGGPGGEQHVHFKKYISSIDFLDATPGFEGTVTYPVMNVTTPSTPAKSMSHTRKQYPILGGAARRSLEKVAGDAVDGRFEIANVSFCLDICLDHSMGVCASLLDAEKAAGTGPGLVSVHAIVSAGSSIQPKHVRVPAGGSAILADGLGSGAQQSVELTGSPMVEHVHRATAEEAPASVGEPGVDEVARAGGFEPNLVLNDDYVGYVRKTAVDVLGVNWRKRVDEVFGVQRYGAPKPPSPTPSKDGGSAADEAYTLAHEVKPQAYVFEATPIVKV